jgi:uncharacterized protein (TIGR02145 family)
MSFKPLVIISFLFYACNNGTGNSTDTLESNPPDTAKILNSTQVTDLKELKIGTQVWMPRNLDLSTFRNGDSIPEVKTNAEWIKAGKEGKPAWCYYNNDPINGKKFGKLYNRYALHDKRGLAPISWHIPDDDEWATLLNYYGKSGTKKLNCTPDWESNLRTNNRDNFLACPGGYRYDDGFDNINEVAYIWSYSKNDKDWPAYYNLLFKISAVFRNYDSRHNGFSVRCIKD